MRFGIGVTEPDLPDRVERIIAITPVGPVAAGLDAGTIGYLQSIAFRACDTASSNRSVNRQAKPRATAA